MLVAGALGGCVTHTPWMVSRRLLCKQQVLVGSLCAGHGRWHCSVGAWTALLGSQHCFKAVIPSQVPGSLVPAHGTLYCVVLSTVCVADVVPLLYFASYFSSGLIPGSAEA